jgi:hypothetical protein
MGRVAAYNGLQEDHAGPAIIERFSYGNAPPIWGYAGGCASRGGLGLPLAGKGVWGHAESRAVALIC